MQQLLLHLRLVPDSAAVAGVLLCSTYPSLTPYTGAMPGIKAFVAAVFGGIGSIPGAFIGGILLGIIEILSKAYIPSSLQMRSVFAVSYCCVACEAYRTSGQEDSGESVGGSIITGIMLKNMNKTKRSNLITYAIVIVAFVVMQTL